MLKIKDLRAYYGSVEALKGTNLNVQNKKITCLIGSNGAGKTTLLKSISGVIRTTGTIELTESGDVLGKSPRYMAKKHVIHVPEGRHIFPKLTVKENLETGTINWHGFFGNKSYETEIKEIYELFPRLEERKNQQGWSLSGGEQQMLAIGRALMAKPKLLMLDEPSMGLAPIVISELFEKIVEINKKGISILLVEQNANLALKVSDYAYILDNGDVTLEGTPSDLENDPRVIQAYLGKFAKAQ